MKIIDERRFDFLPQKMWKSLTKVDQDNLRGYRRKFRWYKDNDEKINSLKKELKKRKEKKKDQVKELTKLNYDLDHLRNDYLFSWSVSKLSNKNYFNFTISRKGHPSKSGTLGSPKLITDHLQTHYKRNKTKLKELKSKGWKTFILKEVTDKKGKVFNRIMDCIIKDKTLKSFTINREFLFPTQPKKKKSKGVSIPIMITNLMRRDLLLLGWSKDEMKHLTPKECWEIINKGVPKKPSRERGRNQ